MMIIFLSEMSVRNLTDFDYAIYSVYDAYCDVPSSYVLGARPE